MTETTLTAYEMNKYFITRNIYTDDGLLKYELTYLDAQEVSFEGNFVTLPGKAKASVLKYDYDETGNLIYEGSYTGKISIADMTSVKFAVRTSREYDFQNNTVTEQSGNIKTVYVNNYLGKPVTVKNIVKSSDLIASAAGTGDETELET
ncbi:MAG: hypothetical protein PUE12_02430, partial [Oscillospiraceae bacterium]|nr:hypothetical protein [Oscillospiraceae bacterium]